MILPSARRYGKYLAGCPRHDTLDRGQYLHTNVELDAMKAVYHKIVLGASTFLYECQHADRDYERGNDEPFSPC